MAPELAVIIVTYNSEHVLPGLFESLATGLAGLAADVVVVDNGSSDGTRAIARHYSGCRLIESSNIGYAGAINLGMSSTGAPAALILNPDILVHGDFGRPLLARLQDDHVGIVVPRVLNPDGSLNHSLRREPSLLRAIGLGGLGFPSLSEYVSDSRSYETPGVFDWALGAAMLVSRNCHEALNGWDSSFFLYSEETDFCLRARDLGWQTWYEPASVVTHAAGGSGRDGRTHAMQIVNRVRLYGRRHNVLASWCYLGLTVLSELSWLIRGNEQSRASLRALLRPKSRPAELACGHSLMPR